VSLVLVGKHYENNHYIPTRDETEMQADTTNPIDVQYLPLESKEYSCQKPGRSACLHWN
jgi:hypothetical protein